MRISDWSSDVCSSDLAIGTEDMHSERRSQPFRVKPPARAAFGQFPAPRGSHALDDRIPDTDLGPQLQLLPIEGLADDLLDERLFPRNDQNARRTRPTLEHRPVGRVDIARARAAPPAFHLSRTT